MDIRETAKGVLLSVRVKTGSEMFKFGVFNDRLVIHVKSPPSENKANREIVKEMKKLFGKDVEIVKGYTSREKIILVRDTKIEDIKDFLVADNTVHKSV